MNGDDGLRSDARANRERILAVARETFAAAPSASLNSVAKAAGVGPGTLYRHFPSREALLLGLYHKEIEDLVALAPALTAAYAPVEAFRHWCDHLADFGQMKHGIADALQAAMTDRDFEEAYWPVVGAIDHLLRACVVSGDFAPGSSAEDVLQLLAFIGRIEPGPEGKAQAQRLIALVIRGLASR
ncbi:TetR/AcrR family transcriptional regulator [Rhizobium binxianense]